MVLTYIRPDADDTDGTWTNESDTQTNLFASIDETVASDADYIKSVHLPDHDICKIRLSDPAFITMRPATVHYRFKKRGETTQQINLDVSLLQGSTEIAKWSESDIGTSYVDGSQALTVPQFNSITDFTDLYLQFDAFSAWWLVNSSVDLSFETGLYYDSSYVTATDSASFLLHADGVDASTTFIDATGRHQISVTATPQIDTAQSKFGGASVLFSSTSQGITSIDSTGSNSDFYLGTGDFTMDCWVRWSDLTGQQNFFKCYSGSTAFAPLIMKEDITNKLIVYSSNFGAIITSTTAVTTGVWYHIAVTRSGQNLRLFLNGTQEGSTYTANLENFTGETVLIEALPGAWVDEIRVLKGTAAWTATFTPPTAPYNAALSGPYAHLSCSRASVGYATTSSGTLTSFASNELRITDLGLLVEDARTNLIKYSQDLSGDADWRFDANASKTDNQYVAPDGTTTVDKITPNAGTNSHYIYRASNTWAAGTLTCSVFVNYVNHRWVSFATHDGVGFDVASFDLLNGVIGSVSAGVTSTIESYGTGVYRLSFTATVAAVSGAGTMYFVMNNADSTSTFLSWTAAGTENVGVWGFQIEQASFPSSYIPTTSAAATRAADAILCSGNLNTVLSALPATAVMDLIFSSSEVVTRNFPTLIYDGTSQLLAANTSATDSIVNSQMSSVNITNNFSPALFSTGVKIGCAVASGARSLSGGGVAPTTNANAVALSSGSISIGGPSAIMHGYIRRLTVWNSKLADATLQGFTNP